MAFSWENASGVNRINCKLMHMFVGSENKMKHHLQGYLAGLSVLVNKLEKPSVLACLHKCKESLEVPAMELLEPGMELLTNSGKLGSLLSIIQTFWNSHSHSSKNLQERSRTTALI